ncbi:sigma-B regulation protein RsbU (phosphoserine phosphatase) [Sphingomonas oligoaromativorans]|nr:sigma-B regulation protein RsbU (phosphoserine phosphatase) [Sphingomonas oligoaromativorans]
MAVDFEDVFETAPCGYVLADKDGRITHANRTFAAWSGRSSEELVGRRFSDLLTVSGKIFYETHVAPTLHMQGSLSEVAFELVGADGTRKPMLVNVAETRPDGAPAQMRFAAFLAVERRTYERGLLDARDKAEATVVTERADSELREQFIAVLGHDLRNPLASISSGIHMLEKESLSDRGSKVVGLMGGSIVRAAALIDNVLDFARGRLGGGMTLQRDASEPLEPVLRQVVSELRSIAPGRAINAHYDLEEPINCDRMRIAQLLSNLLGNALTHGAKDMPVWIKATTADGELAIAVSNGGQPIPPATLQRLFQPFFRGNDRLKHGLGLGLHIASEIARAHGGTLVARSDPTATTFVFTMPLSH